MIDKTVRKMTGEQKQMVIDAKDKNIICGADGNKVSGLFRGRVNIVTGKNVSVTVAKTEMTFADETEALDAAEAIVNAVLGSTSEPESKPKKKPAKKKKRQ